MISRLNIECDYIKNIDSRLHENKIRVTLENVDLNLIDCISSDSIIEHQDVDELLEAIYKVYTLDKIEKFVADRKELIERLMNE